MQVDPQNIETHETKTIKEISKESQEKGQSNLTTILEETPSNDQHVVPLVSEYYNVSLIPYKSSWYTQYFQQVSKYQKMKSKTLKYFSSTIQSILFGLYNHFIF